MPRLKTVSQLLEHASSRMAYGKIRGKLFVLFTCIILIECRSFLQLSGTQETKDEGSEIIPEQFMPYKGWFDESLADFEYPGDDASVAELQKKTIIRGQLVSSSEAALGAMSPKLMCGDDLMKLQLNGPEVAQIELCRDNGAPVSLTELPPHCGQTISTNGGLVYATPYDGCGVMQQGGSYVMQIQWRGNSAVISCPMFSTTANETFLGPNTPTYLQILLQHSPPDALSSAADPMPDPTTKPTVQAPTQNPQLPGYPQGFWPYYYPHYHHYGKPKPTEKPVPTFMPTTTSVAQAPTQKPQLPGYPQGFWPFYYPHYHRYGKPKPTEKPVPTFMPTTASVAQAPTQKPQLPGYPLGFWPYYYPHYHRYGKPKPTEKPVPTSMPTTSVAQAPSQKPQLPGYPQGFWPFYYPHYHHHGKPTPPKKPDPAIPTASPSSSPATSHKPQPPMYPGKGFPQYNYYPNYHPFFLQPLYSQYPLQPPNMPPITPTPQPSIAAAGC